MKSFNVDENSATENEIKRETYVPLPENNTWVFDPKIQNRN